MRIFRQFKELYPLFLFLGRYWPQEGIMLILIVVGSVCSLTMPFILGKVIDEALPFSKSMLLIELVLITIAINILRFFVGWASEYLNSWLAGRVISDIKTALFGNLLTLPYSYFEKNKPGEIIQIVSQEVDKIQHFLTTSIIRLLNNGITILGLCIMLCYLNYRLFLMAMVMMPIVIVLNLKISNRVRKLVRDTGIKEGDLHSFYFERVRSIALVKLFNSDAYEQNRLRLKIKNLVALYLENTKLISLGGNASFFLVSLSPLIILIIGGFQVIEGLMTIGYLVAFMQYCNRLIPPANDIMGLYIDFARAHESALRILPFLNLKRQAQNYLNCDIDDIYKISCKDISYFIDGNEILSNVNLEFRKGNSYGITGTNGAGKSTLVKVLSKLYNSNVGEVFINDKITINEVPDEIWHERITVINQHSLVLHESIRENLSYVNREVTEEKLWECLEIVGLRGYVEGLKCKLDTLIGDGEDCANPSGGQLQKLSLARLFLKQPDVIILDEVTSSMDFYSSRKVLRHILELFFDKIIICVTHDPAEMVLFGNVYFLENGVVQGIGSHEELLNTNQRYSDMFLCSVSK